MGAFDTNLGFLLLGIFFNTFLYGLVSYQYAVYYSTKFNDATWIKLLVVVLFCLDTFHSASVIYMAWVYCVENFDNPLILLARSRTGFHNTDTIIKRLIRATLQTGLLTGVFSMLALVTFLRSPRTMLYGMFGILIGRIYTSTLMDTLLVRHTLRRKDKDSLNFNEYKYENDSNDIWNVGSTHFDQLRQLRRV
ncbi:hypothetical protein H0H93_006133 [Arthromyces matolae]|nr:hypothetical protein H0H93_006133 [Arthromyces matolae]